MNKTIFLFVTILVFVSCVKNDIAQEALEKYMQAKTFYLNGDTEQALEKFTKIQKEYPNFHNNNFMIGKIHFFNKDYDTAKEIWTAILTQNPYHIDSNKWLTRLLLFQNDPKKAETLIARALEISSEDPELLQLMAKAKQAQNKLSQAIEFYKKSLLFKDKLVESHLDLAEIYRRFGLSEKAKEELEKAISLLDKDSSLYNPIKAILTGLTNEN